VTNQPTAFASCLRAHPSAIHVAARELTRGPARRVWPIPLEVSFSGDGGLHIETAVSQVGGGSMSSSYQVIFDLDLAGVSILEAVRQALALVRQEPVPVNTSLHVQVLEKRTGKSYLVDLTTGQATPVDTSESDWWNFEDPTFPLRDWRYEVANNDTRLGYLEWVRINRSVAAGE